LFYAGITQADFTRDLQEEMMAIRQLSLTDFRNLKSTTIDFNPGINFISGANGSGKTSLLESIYTLCQAHSFRTHQLKQCIGHDKNSFLLFGRFDDFKAGIAKSTRKLEIHVDGQAIKRRSELVKRAPINIVNADSFQLIDGPPQKRRAYLDWCLFHVEPSYAENWVVFQHALKQRNRLLKSGKDLKLLDYWDQHLLEPSIRLSQMRRDYCDILKTVIDDDLRGIMQALPLELVYQPGWTGNSGLAGALSKARDTDIRRGFTGAGIHRDDLRLLSEGKNVNEVLSRGQAKRLCLTLILAILKIVKRKSDSGIILLIDDLNSELDHEARNRIYQQLLEMDLQLVISNIEAVVPDAFKTKEVKMFHVEHGIIKPRKSS
jgi:DNA replication and repair protein RecF